MVHAWRSMQHGVVVAQLDIAFWHGIFAHQQGYSSMKLQATTSKLASTQGMSCIPNPYCRSILQIYHAYARYTTAAISDLLIHHA